MFQTVLLVPHRLLMGTAFTVRFRDFTKQVQKTRFDTVVRSCAFALSAVPRLPPAVKPKTEAETKVLDEVAASKLDELSSCRQQVADLETKAASAVRARKSCCLCGTFSICTSNLSGLSGKHHSAAAPALKGRPPAR